MEHAEGGAHSGGYADRRRATNDHFGDGAGHFAVVRVGVMNFFAGEAALIEHDDAAVGPLYRLRYIHAIRRPRNSFANSGKRALAGSTHERRRDCGSM